MWALSLRHEGGLGTKWYALQWTAPETFLQGKLLQKDTPHEHLSSIKRFVRYSFLWSPEAWIPLTFSVKGYDTSRYLGMWNTDTSKLVANYWLNGHYLLTNRHFYLGDNYSLTCGSICRSGDVGTCSAVEASIAGSCHIGHACALTVVTWELSTNTSVTVIHQEYHALDTHYWTLCDPSATQRVTVNTFIIVKRNEIWSIKKSVLQRT